MNNKNITIIYLIPLLFVWIFVLVIWRTIVNANNESYHERWSNLWSNKSISKYLWDKILNGSMDMIKQAQQGYLENFDFESESSLQKYIDKKSPLKSDYKPLDLEKINSDFVVMWSENEFYLRMSARIAFQSLAKEFYSNFGQRLYLVSAYRSYKNQLDLLRNGCSINVCAEAWFSEHQLWLAVDIHISQWSGSYISMQKDWKYYKRLSENAYKFWFHNTYQENNVENKMAESRHRAYKWKALAKFLYEKNMTIGEYYKLLKD